MNSARHKHELDHDWIQDFAEDPPPPPSIFEVVVSKPTSVEAHRPAVRALRPDQARTWLMKHVIEDSGLLTAGVMIVVTIMVVNFVVRGVKPGPAPDPAGLPALPVSTGLSVAGGDASRARPPQPLLKESPIEPVRSLPAAATRAAGGPTTRGPAASRSVSTVKATRAVPREEAPPVADSSPAPSPLRQTNFASAPARVPPAVPEPPKAIAPSPAPASTPARMSDTSAVESVIERYRQAFVTLNPYPVEEFWPGVNTVALTKSFDQLESQSFDFDSCRISVTGNRAEAICQGTATFVTKVGSRRTRTEPRRWVFQLMRPHDRWVIDKVDAR